MIRIYFTKQELHAVNCMHEDESEFVTGNRGYFSFLCSTHDLVYPANGIEFVLLDRSSQNRNYIFIFSVTYFFFLVYFGVLYSNVS